MTEGVRAGESREENTRKARSRPPLQNRYRGKLSVMEDVVRAAAERGMRLRWIGETCHGEEISNNVQQRMMDGWEPLKAKDYPQLVGTTLPGKKEDVIIRRGGQILCQKPLEEVQWDLEDLRAENMDVLTSVNWGADGEDPSMPRFTIGQQGVSMENVTTQRKGAAFKE